MKQENLTPFGIEEHSGQHGSLKTYLLGFFFSLLFTLVSFAVVYFNLFAVRDLYIIISISALLQAVVQLVLFLHLGAESKPKWNLMVFLFMALIVLCIVLGSLWIMNEIDYRTME